MKQTATLNLHDMTIGEAAALTGLHKDTLRSYVKKGKIDSYQDKMSGFYYITANGIEELMEAKPSVKRRVLNKQPG